MWNSVLFVVAVIAVSVAQPPPECLNPPLVNPETCCPNSPQFVTKQMVDECTTGPISCDSSNCILKKNNFLTADGKVDKAALSAYAVSPDWTAVTATGLQQCFNEMAGATCESMKFVGCMAHYLMNNCPAAVWSNTADCTAVKTFLNNCRPPSM